MSDLAARGLLEEEYFLTGRAVRYELRPGHQLSRDGRWSVRPAGSEPYVTRILVRRPRDGRAFNGTVLVTWMNVSAGWDWWDPDTPELVAGGYAVVGVSCQRVGIDGQTEPSPQRPDLGPPVPEGLRIWDPRRYGSLSIRTDHAGYDIFTQAARLVAEPHPRGGPGVMGDLRVERLVGYGMSQSANLLASYVNAVHPLERVFDGFLLERYVGSGFSLPAAGHPGEPTFIPEGSHLLREDTEEPIMIVNAESDTSQYFPASQPDSDRFRLWEVAGVSHVGMWSSERFARRYTWEFGRPWPRMRSPEHPNYLSLVPVVDAAFRRLHEWLAEGSLPRSMPRIEVGGRPPRIRRDGLGHAIGGVRLPEVEAPLYRHIGISEEGERGVLGLRGRSVPLASSDLAALYSTPDIRSARYRAAVRRAVASGVLLPHDADHMLRTAAGPA
jgi:hypothetical protein